MLWNCLTDDDVSIAHSCAATFAKFVSSVSSCVTLPYTWCFAVVSMKETSAAVCERMCVCVCTSMHGCILTDNIETLDQLIVTYGCNKSTKDIQCQETEWNPGWAPGRCGWGREGGGVWPPFLPKPTCWSWKHKWSYMKSTFLKPTWEHFC